MSDGGLGGCLGEKWTGRWEMPGPLPGAKKGLQEINHFSGEKTNSPEVLFSASYTNKSVKVLIAQMASFEKGKARARLLPCFITLALCLS